MKRIFQIGAAATLAFALATAASAQRVGDWVLGQWQGGSDWYPGVIAARQGNQITIRYDDGTLETRPANQVRPYNWRVGSRVVCRFTNGRWYDATITAIGRGGSTISIRYDDGVNQTTQTGRCRSE